MAHKCILIKPHIWAENGVVHYHYPYPVYIQATEWVDMEIGKGKIKSM
jgi:hypothetical protein